MTQQQSAALLPNPATPAAAAVQGQGGGALAMSPSLLLSLGRLHSRHGRHGRPAALLPRTPATPALAALSDGAKILGAFMGGVTVRAPRPAGTGRGGGGDEPRFMAGDVLTHEMGESLLHLLQCKHRLLAAAGARDLAAAAAAGVGRRRRRRRGTGRR